MLKVSCVMYMSIQISRELHVCSEIFGRALVRLCWLFSAYLPNPFPTLPPPAVRPTA